MTKNEENLLHSLDACGRLAQSGHIQLTPFDSSRQKKAGLAQGDDLLNTVSLSHLLRSIPWESKTAYCTLRIR